MYQVFRFLQQKVGPSDERVKKAGFEGPKDRTDRTTESTGHQGDDQWNFMTKARYGEGYRQSAAS